MSTRFDFSVRLEFIFYFPADHRRPFRHGGFTLFVVDRFKNPQPPQPHVSGIGLLQGTLDDSKWHLILFKQRLRAASKGSLLALNRN